MCSRPKIPQQPQQAQVIAPPPSAMPAALGSAYGDDTRANFGVRALRVAKRLTIRNSGSTA